MATLSGKNNILTAAFFLLVMFAAAQPAVTLADVKARHKDENSVILKRATSLDISFKGDDIAITQSNLLQVMYLNDKGVNGGSEKIPYDPNFYALKNLEAYTWVPDKESYRKARVAEFNDVQDVNGDSFYDSHRFKQFRFPNVQQGAITECVYEYDLLNPFNMGSFSFANYIDSEEFEYIVTVPEEVEIGMLTFGSHEGIESTTVKKGKNTIYTWRAKNVKALKSFDFSMSNDKYLPQIYVFIKSYKRRGKEVVMYGGKDELYKHNYSYVKDRNRVPGDEIRQVVDSLKAANTSDEAIVKGIFYWVQDNVRYIAFEDGMGGVVPRDANMVCSKRYGDCKDMANLICNMMDYSGIPGYLCWVGTREIDFTYDELPLGYSSNHMIAAYKKDGEVIYLDATSKLHKFGLPSAGIQGKQVMMSLDADHFETPFVPVVPSDVNYTKDVAEVKLNGNSLAVTGKVQMDGFVKSMNAQRLEDAGPQHEKEQMLDILKRGNNKCKLVNYKLDGLTDRDKELTMNYEVLIQDYVRNISDELYINFNMDKTITSMRPDTTDRICGVDYYYAFNDVSVYEMPLPDGYQFKKIPDNLEVSSEFYDIRFKYEVKNDVLTVSKDFSLKKIFIPQDHLDQWIKDLDKVSQAFQQVVVLSKK